MKHITIERKNPKTGFKETLVYTGPASQVPEGWKIREVQPCQ